MKICSNMGRVECKLLWLKREGIQGRKSRRSWRRQMNWRHEGNCKAIFRISQGSQSRFIPKPPSGKNGGSMTRPGLVLLKMRTSSKKWKQLKQRGFVTVVVRGKRHNTYSRKRLPFLVKSCATTTHHHATASRHREKFARSPPRDQKRHQHQIVS